MSNSIKQAWLHARNAFYKNWFPPTLMPYENIGTYRYPAPGSDPIPEHRKVDDFRTAFKDSVYNVRYANEYENRFREEDILCHSQAAPVSTEDHMISLGLLRAEDRGDIDKRAAAKATYDSLWQEGEQSPRVKEQLGIMPREENAEPRKYIKDLLEHEQTKAILELQNKNRGLDDRDEVLLVEKDVNGYPRNVRIGMAEAERRAEEVHFNPSNKKWGAPPKHLFKD